MFVSVLLSFVRESIERWLTLSLVTIISYIFVNEGERIHDK